MTKWRDAKFPPKNKRDILFFSPLPMPRILFGHFDGLNFRNHENLIFETVTHFSEMPAPPRYKTDIEYE